MTVPNLLLRVVFALSIVGVAIGMTAAASDTVARCDATSVSVASGGTAACAPAPVVAGYQGAPNTAESAGAPAGADRAAPSAFTPQATMLVALATGLVVLSIFAILLGYRPRPGGVRASHR
ncbi:MAG TPA: hypothetical protein VGR87_04980 [Candidatus Limnocylindria bacterium]|jgi:hypothetical protein|nr:hypothetical protein [Candidatus Limnocylindria bacterium]